MSDIERAADAVRDGGAVVYPTETVYGLGADALNPDAVERVFAVKRRSPEQAVSLGVPDVETALDYTAPSAREVAFMREFLPGPVTVVVERRDPVPDVLTAGRDRVGVRVPDHDVALALYEAADTPVTATSANVSGRPSVRDPAALDEAVRDAAAAVLDGGVTEGAESTVVDVATGTVHREGALADEVRAWLEDHGEDPVDD